MDVHIGGLTRAGLAISTTGTRRVGGINVASRSRWKVEMMRVLFLSSVLCIAAAGAIAGGDERVKIAVSPAYSFAPSQMRVRVRLQPNADNRLLAIIADAEDFYRRSEVQLDGDESPSVIEMSFPEVPGGEYEISAVLIDNTGKECAVSRAQATVISKRAEP